MNVRHIIWDWNGTLLDDTAASVNAINRLLAEHRLPPTTREDYLAHFGFPVRDYYTLLGFPPDLAPDTWQTLAQTYHDYFNAEPQGLFPDTRAALQRCADAGLSQSVLSALHQPLLLEALARHGLASFFKHIRGVDDLHGASKLGQGRKLLRDLALPSEKTPDLLRNSGGRVSPRAAASGVRRLGTAALQQIADLGG
ncbi:MAG: HAD family hydrolase, partial [Kiritimatiellaeota bacterium]|nr:HAD family hydrolase [Kiritimatiellota bacterium]